MIKEFFNKLYGNTVVLAHLRGQRRVPYLPQEKLYALRDARLRGIVRYASKTVPYYQKLFRREKLDPREIKTVDDLDNLSLLDREVVRENPALFVSTSNRGKKSIPFTTSGTTGMPLTFHHDPNSLLANIAFGEREREVISSICGKEFGYREVVIHYPGSTPDKVWDFYRCKTYIPVRPHRLVLSVLDPVEYNIEAINDFRPDVLVSYGSYLETLFKTLQLRGIEMHLPRMLIYAADMMTDEGKRFIEDAFGIPVFTRYNAVEAFKIGFFCEARKGFHLHEDLCHVKIVNGIGEKVADGEKGEVVISNLVNRGTVLLNYRIGDIGSISSIKCSCGRNLMLLSELEGRLEDIIFLPNGEFVHPRAVWRVFKGRYGILQYQVIQHTPERFELKLVTDGREIYQSVIGDILTDLKHLLGECAVIHSEYCQVSSII